MYSDTSLEKQSTITNTKHLDTILLNGNHIAMIIPGV
jgi:hypothetical protein